MSFSGLPFRYDPDVLHSQQKEWQKAEREGDVAARDMDDREIGQKSQLEKQKGEDQMTNLLKMLGGGRAGGFGQMPAYNMHEQNGRGGLVDPSLTGQQTQMPAPFSRRYELAAGAAAVQGSLPPHLAGVNSSILQAVATTHPLARKQLHPQSSIYQQIPSSYIDRRVNIEMQRSRENSIYGYAGWV